MPSSGWPWDNMTQLVILSWLLIGLLKFPPDLVLFTLIHTSGVLSSLGLSAADLPSEPRATQ
ncbi:MAG: hypothetical protein ACE5NC_09305 [Anaerolineae bacterium]